MSPWIEVADRVFVRRYAFYDQTIGVVLGGDGVLVVDTRSSDRQAAELRADLARLTDHPPSLVVNTHHHHDHVFGNRAFRPAPIWGQTRCPERLRESAERQRAELTRAFPDLAPEWAAVEIDPPDRTLAERAELDLGDRRIELRHLGRGHTDTDLVVLVPDAATLFAGDLIEEGAPPAYDDAYPLDWPATLAALLDLVAGWVVPGHGGVVDRGFVERQAGEIAELAELARGVAAGELALEVAAARSPWGPDRGRAALERALAQLRADLD